MLELYRELKSQGPRHRKKKVTSLVDRILDAKMFDVNKPENSVQTPQ